MTELLRRADLDRTVTIITLVIYGLSIERQWHYLIVLIPGMTAFSAVSVLPVVAGINYATGEISSPDLIA